MIYNGMCITPFHYAGIILVAQAVNGLGARIKLPLVALWVVENFYSQKRLWVCNLDIRV